MMIKLLNKRGFNAIELLIATAIVVLISSVAYQYFGDMIEDSRLAAARQNEVILRDALARYFKDNMSYPNDLDSLTGPYILQNWRQVLRLDENSMTLMVEVPNSPGADPNTNPAHESVFGWFKYGNHLNRQIKNLKVVSGSSSTDSFTLVYSSAGNGTISGNATQGVEGGGSGTAVTAVPDPGYDFVKWSDNNFFNPRTDTNVTANISVTAEFEPINPGFTAEAWIRWPFVPFGAGDTRWATIIVDGTTDNNSRYHFQHDSNNSRYELAIRTGSGRVFRNSITTTTDNRWDYVAGVYDQTAGLLRVYVNGVEEATGATANTGLIPSPGLVTVGGPAGIPWPDDGSRQRKFMGEMYNLGVHERAFTPAEIANRASHPPPN